MITIGIVLAIMLLVGVLQARRDTIDQERIEARLKDLTRD